MDHIICNRFNIKNLANQTLKSLNLPLRLKLSDIDLREASFAVTYGQPQLAAVALAREVVEEGNILLDTTYTSKVALFMRELIRTQNVGNKIILYWHTFSSAAMKRPPSLVNQMHHVAA